MRQHIAISLIVAGLALAGCKKSTEGRSPVDPQTAPRAEVDRFSAAAGTLFVRDASPLLPAAGAPIDFDARFRTKGLGPTGGNIEYYTFDVQPAVPIPIYVLFREGEQTPVAGQLNIVDHKPGDPGYTDFWLVHQVTVGADYQANSLTSLAQIQADGLTITPTTTLVNCPIVPAGSTATTRLGGGSADLTMGWYREQVVYYFSFEEHPLTLAGTEVPTVPIWVTFNINPGLPGGGPPSGFATEPGTDQTHNVLFALPGSPAYSPLWEVNVYDNADFATTTDATSAAAATPITGVPPMSVNCPAVVVP